MKKDPDKNKPVAEFLADADEIEMRPLPRSARLTLHLMLAGTVCFVVWASMSKMDVNVTTRGKLVTLQPNIVVQPLETGVIQKIDVEVGDIVKKGQRLARLDSTFPEADETQLRNRLQSYDNEVKRLEAEIAGKGDPDKHSTDSDIALQHRLSNESQANYQAQMQTNNENIARLQASLVTNHRDQDGLKAQLSVLQDSEKMQAELVAQKYAIRSRLLEAQERVIEAQRNLEMSKNRELEIQRELAAAQSQRRTFDTGWHEKILEEMLSVERERDGVAEQLRKAERMNSLVNLTSPADGVILEIAKLSQGSVIRGAETLFTIVPLNSELEAEVHIEAEDIGYIKIGDLTHVKLDAFPFQKHGMLIGKIRTISQDAFKKENSMDKKEDGYYLCRIHLDTIKLNGLPVHAKLMPGMTISAEITVGKRSVMSYILWPLTKTLNESGHEP
jgi:HlyD family secretion protein